VPNISPTCNDGVLRSKGELLLPVFPSKAVKVANPDIVGQKGQDPEKEEGRREEGRERMEERGGMRDEG
jgi:hypothetical protein